jgi:hypothetical protein
MTSGAHAQAYRMKLTLDDMVERSDVIVVAECTERKMKVVNGNLVTVYTMRPAEFLKGFEKLDKNGEMQMDELGGKLDNPPLIQKPDGYADIAKGEEVLLFTKRNQSKAKNADDPRFISSQNINGLRIIGRYQGRFTVVKHPATGQKIVAKPSGLTHQLRRLDQGKPTIEVKSTGSGGMAAKLADDAAVAKNSLEAKLNAALGDTQAHHEKSAAKSTEPKEYLAGYMPLDTVREKVREKIQKQESNGN